MLQRVKDTLFFPIRALFPNNEHFEFLGLTSLKEERFRTVLKYIRGSLLDVGCGSNELSGYVDVAFGGDRFPWLGIDILLDAAELPFPSNSFGTVSFVASLNHIVRPEAALREAYRVLEPGGRCLITMLNPAIGWIGHRVFWRERYDPDEQVRGVQPGERYGISHRNVIRYLRSAEFLDISVHHFALGLNHLYVAHK